MIAVGRNHLDDVAEAVARARIGGIDLLRRAPVVVGQADIDLLRTRIGFHVLRPVHPGGAEQIGGATRLDQHVRLAVKPVRRGRAARAENERQPVEAAVAVVAGDRQHALIEEVAIGGRVARIDLAPVTNR